MGHFTNKEIKDINLLVESRKILYENTTDIRSLYEASKKMYSDDSAFILELIQNADDCEAKKIIIHITEEKLCFEHDGRYFDLKDIEQITKASSENNRKANDDDKIGQFGIGFKSVFNVSHKPTINSGKYKFEIENYIIPRFISPNIDSEDSDFSYPEFDRTIIELPFIDISKYEITKEKLNSLSEKHILFLNNVISIEIIIDNESHKLEKNKEQALFFNNIGLQEEFVKKFANTEIEFVNINDKYYLVSSGLLLSPLENQYKLYKNTQIAFEVKKEKSKYRFTPIKNAKFFVFFPTNTPTGLNFYIHGKYTVGMNRKELNNYNQDFFKDENNKKIIDITCGILCKTIEFLADFKLIDIHFFDVIIQKEIQSPISKLINAHLKEFFLNSSKFLLNNKCNNINNLLFTDDPDIIDIFLANDLYREHFWIEKEYVAFYHFFSKIENVKLINLNFIKNKIKSDKTILEKVNFKKLYEYLQKSKVNDLEFIKTTIGKYESMNCPDLYIYNSIENLGEIKNEIKEKLDLDFNPLFIDENYIEEIGKNNSFKTLDLDDVIKFIDEKFFSNHSELIKNTGQYFAGFNLVMELMKIKGGNLKLKNIPLLTKNEDKGYLKVSKENAYFLKNQQLKSLYIKTAALKESDFIDTEIYERNVPDSLKEVFLEFLKDSGVKKHVFNASVKTGDSFTFYNELNKSLFDNRHRQQDYSYQCHFYNPGIQNVEIILKYLSNDNISVDINDSITFFHLIADFCNQFKKNRAYFEYFYRDWRRVYLKEIDLYTLLRDHSWIWIQGSKYKGKQVSYSMLKENGYIKEDFNSLQIKELCELLEINISSYNSKDTETTLKLLEDMDSTSLEMIGERVEFLLKSKSLHPQN